MALIAVLDSGVGGLSIYQEVQAQYREHQYLFVSDNQAFPYGTRAESELLARVALVVEEIVAHFSPDILIVACNTASTICLPMLREKHAMPIIGVVPAIKPAATLSQSKVIGLLATPATIQREYTDRLIKEFASDCQVLRVGSSELVSLVEEKLYYQHFDIAELQTILSPFLEYKKLDALVLACTHFPLINKEIGFTFKQKNHAVTLVDSSAGIARRVGVLLKRAGLEQASAQSAANQAVFTSSELPGNHFKQFLRDIGFHETGFIDC